MSRVHIFISGRVQAVFFRAFIKNHATELGVFGWVRNVEDGKVEVVAEGDKKKLIELIKLIKIGPPLARVERVEISWEKASREFQTFSLLV